MRSGVNLSSLHFLKMAINNVDFGANISSYQTEEAEETKDVAARKKTEDVGNQRRVKDISGAAGQKKKNQHDRGKKILSPSQEAVFAKQLNAIQRNPAGFAKKNRLTEVELFYLQTILHNPYGFDTESVKYAQERWSLLSSRHNMNENIIHKVVIDTISVQHVLVLMAMCRDSDSQTRRKRSRE